MKVHFRHAFLLFILEHGPVIYSNTVPNLILGWVLLSGQVNPKSVTLNPKVFNGFYWLTAIYFD